jgi:hypothetical protein
MMERNNGALEAFPLGSRRGSRGRDYRGTSYMEYEKHIITMSETSIVPNR